MAVLFLVWLSCGCERRQDRAPAAGDAENRQPEKPDHRDGSHQMPLDMRLMSFNLRYENPDETGDKSWHQRVVPVVRRIAAENPDVLAVQEALHGQVADLWASLVHHDFAGCGRDDGRHAGEFTGVFFRSDRFRRVPGVGGPFWLSDTPEIPGSKTWGNSYPRMALHVRLEEISSGRNVDVFTTHWDHRHQLSREKSARLMADRIRAAMTPGIPVILLGDFNAVESNPALAWLRSSGRPDWIDVFQALHPRESARTTLHFWHASRAGRLKVDHILVSSPATLISARILDEDRPALSDHFPVTARVRFPGMDAVGSGPPER